MKALLAALALVLPTAALATDLPSRKAAPAFTAPVAVDDGTGWYGGLNVGGNYSWNADKARASVGANGGYDFGAVRLEGTYDHFGSGRFGFDKGAEAFQGN